MNFKTTCFRYSKLISRASVRSAAPVTAGARLGISALGFSRTSKSSLSGRIFWKVNRNTLLRSLEAGPAASQGDRLEGILSNPCHRSTRNRERLGPFLGLCWGASTQVRVCGLALCQLHEPWKMDRSGQVRTGPRSKALYSLFMLRSHRLPQAPVFTLEEGT